MTLISYAVYSRLYHFTILNMSTVMMHVTAMPTNFLFIAPG